MERNAILFGGALVFGCVLISVGANLGLFLLTDMTTDSEAIFDTSEKDEPEVNVVNRTADSTVESAQESLNGVVSIHTEQDDELVSQGSGFVYADNYIMTNQHVVEDADTYYVQYRNGEWTEGHVLGSDVDTDIAVIEPNDIPSYAESLPLQEDLPKSGSHVVALGSPGNLDSSVTTGVISGTERSMTTEDNFVIPDIVQTDAALNPGNSGGPLVNAEDGAVVGVNRATEGENIGFAVSTRLANHIGLSLIENGDHEHSYLGVRTIELMPILDDDEDYTENNGLIVRDVIEDGPTDGILHGGEDVEQDDMLLEVDGNELQDNEDLTNYMMRATEPGDEIELTVYRDGDIVMETVQIGSRPTSL